MTDSPAPAPKTLADLRRKIPVEIAKAEKVLDHRGGTMFVLHYPHPTFAGSENHSHFIPEAALASRAQLYGLDPDSPTFIEDVFEHIIYEGEHPDTEKHGGLLLEGGVTDKIREVFPVDRGLIKQHLEPQVDLARVKQHLAEIQASDSPAFADLPAWLQPGAPNLDEQQQPPSDDDLIRLSPAELLARPTSG